MSRLSYTAGFFLERVCYSSMMEQIGDFFYQIVRVFSDSIYLAIIKEDRYEYLVSGFQKSIQITLLAALLGITIGLLLAVAKLQGKGPLYTFASGYISVIRGTPVVVQLTIIYFIILGQSGLPEVLVAAVAFGINSGAYVAEIIRGGIQAVDRGQMEAGRSLGLNYRQTMTNIIIPQAVKNVLPALGNEFVVLLKETSVAGYIGIMDLNKAGSKISSITYNGMVAPFIVAYIYFVLTTALASMMNRFERRMRKSD